MGVNLRCFLFILQASLCWVGGASAGERLVFPIAQMHAKVAAENSYADGCESEYSTIPLMARQPFEDLANRLFFDDFMAYLTGGSSIAGGTSNEGYVRVFEASPLFKMKSKYGGKKEILRDIWDNDYSITNAVVLGGRYYYTRPEYMDLLACEFYSGIMLRGRYADFAEDVSEAVASMVSEARVGQFEVKVNSCKAVETVGTGNRFAEPKVWEGSRFYIVDASFKNMDTESRLPLAGSLFINYDGVEYEYDSTESIMTDGYNIWFKQVNPLVSMSTKLVYRIPDEISGMVYWVPGRNPEGQRLWCGRIEANSN
ncbi:DUF4352 domain-containing protein [Halopseudomonas sp.]|uniref:DUF4352 domain-containing protein n=1 Tax=Halopseudomonas sp. TaxID=2901191 RepID=UPI00311D6A43